MPVCTDCSDAAVAALLLLLSADRRFLWGHRVISKPYRLEGLLGVKVTTPVAPSYRPGVCVLGGGGR